MYAPIMAYCVFLSTLGRYGSLLSTQMDDAPTAHEQCCTLVTKVVALAQRPIGGQQLRSIYPPISLMGRHAAERDEWEVETRLFRQGAHDRYIMEEPYADCMRTEAITTVNIRGQGGMVALPAACPLTYACVLYHFSDSSTLAGHLEAHNVSANHK